MVLVPRWVLRKVEAYTMAMVTRAAAPNGHWRKAFMLSWFEVMNAARTMPSAMPMRQAHSPMRHAKAPRLNAIGCTAGMRLRDQACWVTKRIQPETRGSAALIRHPATGGRMAMRAKVRAAKKKARGISITVRLGGSLRYSSPYPKSIMPDPMPVTMAPMRPQARGKAPCPAAFARRSVPRLVSKGPALLAAGWPIRERKARPAKALASNVAKSDAVDKR